MSRRSTVAALGGAFLGLLAVSPGFGQALLPTVFVANNVGDNIKSFRLNADGTLTGIGTFAVGDGPQAISLSPDGRFIAVAHGTVSTTTEELRILEVNPDGTLTPRLTTLVPDSPLDTLWVNNTKLAVTKTGSPAHVRMLDWNAAANSLVSVGTFSTGAFNSSLATTGQFLYANDTTNDNITAFRVNADGSLTGIEVQSTAPYFPVNIAAAPGGQFLYAAGGISGDGNRVMGFRINADGSLEPTTPPDFTSPGESPKNFAFSEDGLYAFVGHGTDATIQSFRVDTATGALTSTGFAYDVGLQGTLGETAVLGDFLFATDNSSAIDGRTGVLSFRIGSDGSLTEIGLFPSEGGRPDYLAVWPGIPEPGSAALLAVAVAMQAAFGGRRRPRRG